MGHSTNCRKHFGNFPCDCGFYNSACAEPLADWEIELLTGVQVDKSVSAVVDSIFAKVNARENDITSAMNINKLALAEFTVEMVAAKRTMITDDMRRLVEKINEAETKLNELKLFRVMIRESR